MRDLTMVNRILSKRREKPASDDIAIFSIWSRNHDAWQFLGIQSRFPAKIERIYWFPLDVVLFKGFGVR
jgi:hypothetical protein